MQKFFRCLMFAALTAMASSASAGELTVKMADGRVTVIATDVPLRQILAEWARVGNTRMVNAEKLTGGPMSIQLVDVPEKQALDILLRSAAGFMTAPRPTPVAGASVYDRVIILATSRPPINTVAAPPAQFGVARPPFQPVPPPQPPPDDDDGDPRDQGPNGPMPPGVQTPGMPFPGPPNAMPPGMVPGGAPVNQAPVTSPRPGMLPQPAQPSPINPYAPIGPNGRPIPNPSGRGGGPGGQQNDSN